ncbi:acid protease [Atractiella rhizophila]|nr:acid protease [Atractiella rhizophila]
MYAALWLAILLTTAKSSPTPTPTPSTSLHTPATNPSAKLLRRSNQRQTSLSSYAQSVRRSIRTRYSPSQVQSPSQSHKSRDVGTEEVEKEKENMSKRAPYGSIDLYNAGDVSYFSQLELGSPPKPFFVLLDTGSSDLWIASSTCSEDDGCPEGVERYVGGSEEIEKPFEITYGFGTARGHLVKDRVAIAGHAVGNQVFGLGFRSIAHSGAVPLVEALAESGTLLQPLVSFAMTRSIDSPNGKAVHPGGVMTLGRTEEGLYEGEIEWFDVLLDEGEEEPGYWAVQLESIGIGVGGIGERVEVEVKTKAVVDTGTSLIGGPPSQIEELYRHISGARRITDDSAFEGFYELPCSLSLNLSFSFSSTAPSAASTSTPYPLNPLDLNLGYRSSTNDGTRYCLSGIYAHDLSTAQGILGDAWLKNVYSVFRYSTPSSTDTSTAFNSEFDSDFNGSANGIANGRGAAIGFARLNETAMVALEEDKDSLDVLDGVSVSVVGWPRPTNELAEAGGSTSSLRIGRGLVCIWLILLLGMPWVLLFT